MCYQVVSFVLDRHYEFKGDDNFATLLTFAQEQELGQQLQWGARHLDIRVSYCEEKYEMVMRKVLMRLDSLCSSNNPGEVLARSRSFQGASSLRRVGVGEKISVQHAGHRPLSRQHE